jgi:hypothetical protein
VLARRCNLHTQPHTYTKASVLHLYRVVQHQVQASDRAGSSSGSNSSSTSGGADSTGTLPFDRDNDGFVMPRAISKVPRVVRTQQQQQQQSSVAVVAATRHVPRPRSVSWSGHESHVKATILMLNQQRPRFLTL